MFMNLDAIPVGMSYYTVYVTTQDEGVTREECEADEFDVIAPRISNSQEWGRVLNEGHMVGDSREHYPATNWSIDMYGEDAMIVGVVSQSDDWVVFDMWRDGHLL